MKKRKVITFLNVFFFGLFISAFIMKMMAVSVILLVVFAGVFVFTVQS